MSNKCVVVLTPNGRRQNVKVTPNTTILQVLEEVCGKQGFKPEEYELTHHRKILDVQSIMRFTGLPNNAQLEMTVAVKCRSESCVKVGLALENGNRVMGEFEPSDSLWHVVEKLCPDEVDTDKNIGTLPVVFYLGREECGVESLSKTTLRSLGLTSGGAILRYFRRLPEERHQQANISAPLMRPRIQDDLVNLSSTPSSSASSNAQELITTNPNIDSAPHNSEELMVTSEPMLEESPCVQGQPKLSEDALLPPLLPSKEKSPSEDVEMDYDSSSEVLTQTSTTSSSTPQHEGRCNEEPPGGTLSNEQEETIIFLGERNAVLFDVATARACRPEDIPDDFFDLTVDDAKQLLRDLKRRQAALQEQPLITSQYRELEKSKQMLNALHQYKRCVIKVQFPNQFVLQGTFTPLEKISHVLEFVRKYLQDPTIDFYIFTTPPKTVLQPEQTLYDAGCVPGALVYFFSSSPCPHNGSFIHEAVMAQACTASAAAGAAATATRRSKNPIPTSDLGREAKSFTSPEPRKPASERSSAHNTSSIDRNTEGPSNSKVPKWFQPPRK